MDEQATTVLGSAIVEWLAEEALRDTEPAKLLGELCQRLRGVGMPVLRGHVAFRVLHPLYDASTMDWTAEKPGSYLVEVTADQLGKNGLELGKDVLSFRREDGVAEHFHTQQNRELLQKLSSETGGSYYTADSAKKLANEISYSEAGITIRETRDLWDMPAVFLALLGLRAAEWLLRRKWGVI